MNDEEWLADTAQQLELDCSIGHLPPEYWAIIKDLIRLARKGRAAEKMEASLQRCSRGEWECLLPNQDHSCLNHCIEIDHDQALAAFEAATKEES